MSAAGSTESAGWEGLGQADPAWGRQLSTALRTEVIGHPLLAYAETTSTNDVAKRMAEAGAPEGLVVVSRAQTRGRGRRGRTWVTFPDQAVYFSALLRPSWPAGEAAWLGILGGLAAADTVRRLGVAHAMIKWPNDVLVHGDKIGGVLVEPRVSDERLDFAVLGIGLNVGQRKQDWPPELGEIATSCRMEGVEVTCDRALGELIERLEFWYQRMQGEGREAVLHDWQAWSGREDLPVLE